MNMNVQPDWEPVVIRKKKPTQSELSKDPKLLQAALRLGEAVAVAKTNVGNKQHTAPSITPHKLDDAPEDFHIQRVPTELKKQIAKARTDKKLTQAQLAQSINEKPQVIQDYESGKAIPNPQILSKMSRILGVHLKK